MIDISKLRERLTTHYLQYHDNDTTRVIVEAHMSGFYIGREQGQAEAQRGLQLMLGLTVPNNKEAAMWSFPMPMKVE